MVAFGTQLEAELNSIEGKNAKEIERKRDRVLTKWLGLKQHYKSPMGIARPKPSDGV